jgi:RHS repeat-associated protein
MNLVARADRDLSLHVVCDAYHRAPNFSNTSVARDILNARYYDNARGQFISQDPVFWGNPKKQDLTDPQSLNSYSYGNDNPINKSDPNGLSVKTGMQGLLASLAATLTAISVQLTLMSVQGSSSLIPSPQQVQAFARTEANPGAIVSGAKSYVSNTISSLKTIGQSDQGDYILGQRLGDMLQLLILGRAGLGALESSAAKVPQVLLNKAAGDAFRDSVAATLRQAGYDIQTEVYKSTGLGGRFIDIDVSKNGVNLGGIEAKVGGSVYSTMQRAKDAWLKIINGYIVNVIRQE